MASRVNVRFVVILAAAVALVFALSVGVFVFVKARSGDRYVRLGDQAMARGDIKAADEFYARAVGKERTNAEWLKKWKEARVRKIPETDTEYRNDYVMYTRGILNSLARVQKLDVEAQCEYLQAIYDERIYVGADRESWEQLITETEISLSHFEPELPPRVRRYRGLAIAGLVVGGAELGGMKERTELGVQDLEAALAADPGDLASANELMVVLRALANRARERGPAESEAYMKKAESVLAAVNAAKPGDPELLVMNLMIEFIDRAMIAQASKSPGARAAAAEAMRPRLAEVGAALKAADPKALSFRVAVRFAELAPQIDGAAGLELASDVIDRALEGAPDSPYLLSTRARVTVMRGLPEDAFEWYGKIVQLPPLPVSLDGLRLSELKRRAQLEQANAAIHLAIESKAEGRDAAFERATQARARLAQMVPERSPDLLYVDGRLMHARGDLRGAQAALTDFIRAPGDIADQVADARMRLADIGLRVDPPQYGLSREHYRQVLKSRPGSIEVHLALAQLEALLENRTGAAELYKHVLELAPDNAMARAQLDLLEGRSEDPVVRVLLEAEKLVRGTQGGLGDDKAASDLLQRSLETHNHDPRLVRALVTMKLAGNDREGAAQVASAALQKRPGDEHLMRLKAALERSDSLESTLALIDEDGAPALEKSLRRRQAYEAYGKRAEAEAELAAAARVAPDDWRVIEHQFIYAMDRKDLPEANRIAERGIQTNADRADGDTYRARLQQAQGNLRDAVVLLERAAQRGNATPGLFRALGLTRLQLGRGPEAVDAFRKALELSPTDVHLIKLYVAALLQTGQKQEALGVARQAESFARRDPQFVHLWLGLEAEAGNRQFARARREELLARNPEDLDNVGALADLYIGERLWDKSRELIDSLRAKSDSLQTISLDARWHSGRGDPAKARQAFLDYVGRATTDADRLQGYMALAQFMLSTGQPEAAAEALRQAAPYQDPATLPVDIALADLLLQYGQPAEAETLFRKALDAGVPDPQRALLKVYVESLIRQGKHAEAERQFTQLGSAADEDSGLMTQRAQVLRELGRAGEARAIIDRAVSRFPDDPAPYVARARMSMGDATYIDDVMADLATAIRLRPTYLPALRTRAQISLGRQKHDDAIKDIQAALEASPLTDELRWNLIDLLLHQNRESEAMVIADAGVKLMPNDLRHKAAAAERFVRAGRWMRAAGFYKQMLAQTPDEGIATACVRAFLAATPPALSEAEAVLATPGLNVEKSWQLLLARAAIRKQQGRDPQVRADCLAAFDQVTTTQALMGWYETMRGYLKSPATVVNILGAVRAPEAMRDWIDIFRANTMLDDDGMREEAIGLLRGQSRTAKDASARLIAAKAAASALAKLNRVEESVEAAKVGAEIADDVALLNDLAWMLSENLNRPAEALPYAERAVAGAPQNLQVIDTVVTVYWTGGDRQKAIQTADAALRLRHGDADKAALALKLANWKLQTGDRAGATALSDYLRETAAESNLPDSFRTNLEQLQKDLDAAK